MRIGITCYPTFGGSGVVATELGMPRRSTRGACSARGLPAGPGAACGRIALTAERAVAMAAKGEVVVLVREETSPEDIAGMHAAAGILTTRGGATSHAAVVARGMGRPASWARARSRWTTRTRRFARRA